ncbi:hypothetical protein CAPTEDRAFT_220290 [Capitella teleta]|uniref:Chromatin-remodeling ATPase INO80 n=1 Tax=Capitella teleta TaxID=283909 RepID=R7UEN0_CAPTE|nr:hypothetical protein CAPTEDRAFT_220290 [Capitella teleta]|eukprot:ELU04541.1 hypothetical protein CAPTEDRAFT_220290 [Capitella teleta]
MTDHVYASIAKPLHIQRVERALDVEPLLNYLEESVARSQFSDFEPSTDGDSDLDAYKKAPLDAEGSRVFNGIVVTRAERRADKNRLYNFSKVRKSRKWLKNVLLSDSSSDEDEVVTEEDLQDMLRLHKMQKKCQAQFQTDPELHQYAYYSVGLLSSFDKFYEHQKLVVGPKKKAQKEHQGKEDKMSERIIRPAGLSKHGKGKKLTPEQACNRRRRLWVMIAKKEIPKAYKQKMSTKKEGQMMLKKVSKECQKEFRKAALQSQKTMKEAWTRARRLSKETAVYWKRFEKVEKEHRKKAEREAHEQRKIDVEHAEMKRQQRKLNFLITQTELYAHFIGRKMSGASDKDREAILDHLNEGEDSLPTSVHDDYGSILAHPSLSTDIERQQPNIFDGMLKGYQLKGMNWLVNLYNQGINGILADEMGLGKTVQSISFLAYLAETMGIWGPFLVIAPASTLHNWQQEVSRFTPKFKVVPYWGNTQDRKVLRKFWNQEHLHTRDASFHVVITSYQLVIADLKYFQRIKWHYMILDEAQAIKSTSSVRWKILLQFNCRNRLLLTGTPIQNTMAELWALLHFIMPTLFDSHDEFNEWFSKDIESHAERQSGIDENQLSRLHMILKPFMLRRVKKDVENELSDKIEILVYCPLTTRQKMLYQAIKNKISYEDLIQLSSSSASSSSSCATSSSTSSLMNLVMQFRKVCNHPELFERREIRSPYSFRWLEYHLPKLIYREGMLHSTVPSKRHLLFNKLSVFNPINVHRSLFPSNDEKCCHIDSAFSFMRFIDLSPSELYGIMLLGLLKRWLNLFVWWQQSYRLHHQRDWCLQPLATLRYSDRHSLHLSPELPLSAANLSSSPSLSQLVFTSPTSSVYAHLPCTLHAMPETTLHRMIRLKHLDPTRQRKGPKSPASPTKTPSSPTKLHCFSQEVIHKHTPRPPREMSMLPAEVPAFLYYTIPKAHCRCAQLFCSDRSAAWDEISSQLCSTLVARNSLLYGNEDIAEQVRWRKLYFHPTQPEGLLAVQPKHGYSGVSVPDKETMVTDAGKLHVLDNLLARLKSEGHRVLIYSQMTRMIDLLEEYMWHRKHTYMRLDGSSKISDRRDMVADFQNRSDIFAFLLSTRAGGLGINLTAADTVIFYDSDWNPTVDLQAMDRAHRLGQTKQVTVYRLICKGTIEERILQRAKEKSEIQRMVISGGNFKPDVLRPKEVVSLLLDDHEMEAKLRNRHDERHNREEGYKEKAREMKRKKYVRTGRGPGRPKKVRVETTPSPAPAPFEANTTIAADEDPCNSTFDSAAASPVSTMSMGSESMQGLDESSNDGLLVVDDAAFPSVRASPCTTPKRGTGRPRGRPRGSGVGRRPRGRGSVQKALGAAEAAAAAAVYGQSLGASTPPLPKRGRGSRGGSASRGSSLFNSSPRS